ncbi:MAG TPA: sensor histidine kinase, partial [Desulfopila sp.]|nr:sensor histidine kinase [Desulfopila sp.]
ISSKESAPTFEDLPLKDVVGTSREEFEAQLQYRQIVWEEFPENPTIRLDRSTIIRVLRNLIENALKYGGPQLSKISIGYQNTPGYHIITVRDNGVGMKVEDSERIFRPFQRKNSSPEQTGSGLGLAIVKEIATRHKGEVWMEPNRKRGVKFCFAISKDL